LDILLHLVVVLVLSLLDTIPTTFLTPTTTTTLDCSCLLMLISICSETFPIFLGPPARFARMTGMVMTMGKTKKERNASMGSREEGKTVHLKFLPLLGWMDVTCYEMTSIHSCYLIAYTIQLNNCFLLL